MNKIISNLSLLFVISPALAYARTADVGHYAKVPDTSAACTQIRRPYESSDEDRFINSWQPKKAYPTDKYVCDGEKLYKSLINNNTDSLKTATSWQENGYCQSNAGSLPGYKLGRSVVKPEDAIEISALQANISDFPEFSLIGSKNGDIALVVTARERSNNGRFEYGEKAAKNGRIIYFQENTSVESPLNFSNLPIYGPSIYQGYPFELTLQFVEIDEKERGLARTIFPALSALGRTVTGAGFNPATSALLDTMGNLLVAGNKDDIVLEYHLEFDPAMNNSIVPSAFLEYGTYIFMSQSKPKTWVVWDEVYYNQKNGRVYQESTCKDPIKGKTWLTFQIKPSDRERIITASEPSRLTDIIEAQNQSQSGILKVINDSTSIMVTEHTEELKFRRYLTVAKSLKEKTPDELQKESNTKSLIIEMLNDINLHFTPTSGDYGSLNASKVKRLLSELSQVKFSDDAQNNADMKIPFDYSSFEIHSAKKSFGFE